MSERAVILYCIPSLEYGGAERQICHLASELTRMGHEVHVAFARGGPYHDRLVGSGAILHDVGARGHYDPRLVLNLARLMRKLKPDVVQTCLTQMDIAAGAAALLTRTPWILCEASAAPAYPRGWKSSLRTAMGKRASAIISKSRQGKEYWRGAGSVVRNGIPLADIDAVEERHADRQTVLFAGRMDDGKNAGTLIDALIPLANDVDFVAVLCGDGPRRSELERSVREHGLAHRILFPGYVANIWERMKSAAVLVSLSRYEGSPNIVLEAMACGCPLVVSDIPAHRELLDDESASFVPCDDAAAAAEAIKRTLSSREAAEARARAARTRAEARSVESMALGYLQIYDGVRARSK